MKTSLAILVAVIAFATSVWAVIQIGMACCPITVKNVPSKVTGVSTVDANFEQRQAFVSFDDTKASVSVLVEATTDAGYPSSVKK